MSDIGVGRDQLRAFVERIERLEEEQHAINADKSEVYKEAKGNGFDVKVMRKVIAIRRQDPNERLEQEAIIDTYLHALGMVPDDAPRVRAHEAVGAPSKEISPNGTADKGYSHAAAQEEINAETGEITEQPDSAMEVSAPHSNVHSLRPAKKLRPNCLNPERCAGMGPTECWSCLKAMSGQSEAAQ